MRPVLSRRPPIPTQSPRKGVTLIEVLMSLMIMSIGISAVAVLFPISMLRSIQATQLTNAAITKYNLEALLDAKPELLFDPDGDYSTFGTPAQQRESLAEHFRSPSARNYVIDPIGFHTHIADGNAAFAGTFGNAAGSAIGVPRFGGGLVTTNGRKIEGVTGTQYSSASTPLEFSALLLAANAFASSSGNWDTLVDSSPIALAAGRIQLPADLDLSDIPTSLSALPYEAGDGYLVADPELYRVVVFSEDGALSESFPLTHVDTTSNVAFYTEDINANGAFDPDEDFNANNSFDQRVLPIAFATGVSRVLLQARKIGNYSWMLSVRRGADGGAKNVDVVVRYANGATLADEQVFEATFVEGTNFVGVRTGGLQLPNVAPGRFVFDAINATWYRVRRVRERTTFGWDFPEYDAVLEVQKQIAIPGGEDQFDRFDASQNRILLNGVLDPAEYDFVNGVFEQTKGPEDRTRPGDGDGTMDYGLIMFPTGVIDVYPLGSRKMPAEFQVGGF